VPGPAHGCGGLVNLTESSNTASISSPDVTNNGQYEPDLDCTWTIISAGNYIINVQFNSFELDNQTGQCNDYVEVLHTRC